MADSKTKLNDLIEEGEAVIARVRSLLAELEDVKNDIKQSVVENKDYRNRMFVSDQRKSMVEIFRLILDYNDQLFKIREKILTSTMKQSGDEVDDVTVKDFREGMDEIVRMMEQKRKEIQEVKDSIGGIDNGKA